ncbi:thioredoxin, mitochondrial-like [Trichosurus vulpecula]|uniref:thioredoxin, mitochondrial-like n=1 Tax=Trichosurus vulpecula TaxID=9337 RepID=UPI00186AFF98|nr:thioredoxin, mitochondrial-like [Trichosurus vulpecula]
MAQRMVLRRFLAPIFSRKLPQCHQAPLPPELLAQGSPRRPAAAPSLARAFSTTKISNVTFNVQDGPDFQDRVVNSETPVVVDFHAQWCGPCKILGPRLEKMVAKQEGKVLMAKVDIDDNTDLAIEYEVSAVPTVLAIKNGDVVDKFVGIKDEDQLIGY